MLRHHVPTVTNITFAIEPSASPSADVNTPVAQRVEELLSAQINPAIAAHGGKIELDEVRDGAVYVRFSGRCQGCTMAEVTLRQGVETLLREHIDGVQSIVDRTDHDAGLDPFFSPGKGGGADG
ncbi:MAG: NifU family protein [Gammaproteobacteria bacterium]|nr:NifU family protein [Gammaproteobacteria bacterium]MDH3467090.1 NifU family protein [Gammaproteobacteria bacterium]